MIVTAVLDISEEKISELEDIMRFFKNQNEAIYKKIHTYCMIPPREDTRVVKFTETESRTVVARGQGRERMGS